MLQNEQQTQTYSLFDHSYAGGSWSMAVIEQAAVLRKRAETAEANVGALQKECNALQAVAEAAQAIRRHIWDCEDCADETGCEEWERLDGVLTCLLAAKYGKPGEKSF